MSHTLEKLDITDFLLVIREKKILVHEWENSGALVWHIMEKSIAQKSPLDMPEKPLMWEL